MKQKKSSSLVTSWLFFFLLCFFPLGATGFFVLDNSFIESSFESILQKVVPLFLITEGERVGGVHGAAQTIFIDTRGALVSSMNALCLILLSCFSSLTRIAKTHLIYESPAYCSVVTSIWFLYPASYIQMIDEDIQSEYGGHTLATYILQMVSGKLESRIHANRER